MLCSDHLGLADGSGLSLLQAPAGDGGPRMLLRETGFGSIVRLTGTPLVFAYSCRGHMSSDTATAAEPLMQGRPASVTDDASGPHSHDDQSVAARTCGAFEASRRTAEDSGHHTEPGADTEFGRPEPSLPALSHSVTARRTRGGRQRPLFGRWRHTWACLARRHLPRRYRRSRHSTQWCRRLTR